MKRHKVILILFLATLCSCWYNVLNGRNKIDFKDSNEDVENQIHVIIDLMSKISVENENSIKKYTYSSETFYINSNKVTPQNFKQLTNSLSDIERNIFKETTQKLLRNGINSVYIHTGFGLWFCNYKEGKNEGFDESRDILYLKQSRDTFGISQQYKILDKKGNLLLLAPINAKIY